MPVEQAIRQALIRDFQYQKTGEAYGTQLEGLLVLGIVSTSFLNKNLSNLSPSAARHRRGRWRGVSTGFQIDSGSEPAYTDAGQSIVGLANRRQGGIFTALQYWPVHWIELKLGHHFHSCHKYAGSSSYRNYIADVPTSIVSFGSLLDMLGSWSGGLQFRYNGPRSLIEDNSVRGEAESKWDENIGSRLAPACKLYLSILLKAVYEATR